MTTMTEDQQLELSSQVIGALPIVSHFLDRLGLEALLARYLPAGDVRVLMAAWRVIRVLVLNLCLEREPLYGIPRMHIRCAFEYDVSSLPRLRERSNLARRYDGWMEAHADGA